MNTLKFTRKTVKTTEQHNLSVNDVYHETIFGKNILFYHPINLNIHITNLCDHDCPYCFVSNLGTSIYCECSENVYQKSLVKIFDELKGKDIEVSLTGGEPTQRPDRLVYTMKLCQEYSFKCRTISTNGDYLLDKHKGKPIIQHLIDTGFVHNIELSLHDEETDEKKLRRLVDFCELNEAELRISKCLESNKIDNIGKIIKTLMYYNFHFHIDSIIFRELVNWPGPKLQDIMQDDYVKQTFKQIDFKQSAFYDVYVYEYDDFIVKHYVDKYNIKFPGALSFKDGILRLGFNGEIIRDFTEDQND